MPKCEILRWHIHNMGVDVNSFHTNSFPNVEWLRRQKSRSYRMSIVPTQKQHTRRGINHNPTYIQFHGAMVYKLYPQGILHIGESTHLFTIAANITKYAARNITSAPRAKTGIMFKFAARFRFSNTCCMASSEAQNLPATPSAGMRIFGIA